MMAVAQFTDGGAASSVVDGEGCGDVIGCGAVSVSRAGSNSTEISPTIVFGGRYRGTTDC